MVCMVAGAKFNLHFSLLRVKMDAEKTTVALKEVNILPSVLCREMFLQHVFLKLM